MRGKFKVNPWLEGRRKEYLRDLVEKFFYCKKTFDWLWEKYQKEGKIEWDVLEKFVGTAENKGELWELKDLSHALLNRPARKITYDFAFEKSIHLLFHDLMSFKEHVYVIKQFTDILSKRYPAQDKELALALKNFQHLISIMKEEIPREVEMAHSMFEVSKDLLRSMLPMWKDNYLIVKYLLDNPSVLEENYGEGASKKIIQEIFPEGIEYAYLSVIEWCKEVGRYDILLKYLDKAEKINPGSKRIKKIKREVYRK